MLIPQTVLLVSWKSLLHQGSYENALPGAHTRPNSTKRVCTPVLAVVFTAVLTVVLAAPTTARATDAVPPRDSNRAPESAPPSGPHPPNPGARPRGGSKLTGRAPATAHAAKPAPGRPSGAPVDVVVHGEHSPKHADTPVSTVTRRDLQERLPRSAPDALRYEPGVFVQQTAHSQASPFVRGRTGQQTVILFDGIRLNTSTFRQGPNQYFFTVDSSTIHHIDVYRGGASVRWGSDAIGGVINALPMEPQLDLHRDGALIRPRTMAKYGSADESFGQRFQLDSQITRQVRVLSGVGYRKVNDLKAAGAVRGPASDELPQVPSFKEDGKTQRGTHFDEITGDVRAVWQVAPRTRLVAAAYAYRQFDAPRTDMCPPAYAPITECMQYDEQFRTLAYAKLQTSAGALAKHLEASVSFQRQHERRTQKRPISFIEDVGRDDVDTWGLAVAGQTRSWQGKSWKALTWGVGYGADVYHDRVQSLAWLSFTDVQITRQLERGMYLDGSTFTHGGVYAEPWMQLGERWKLRLGGRVAGAAAKAPGNEPSGSEPVDKSWITTVANAGVTYYPHEELGITLNVDRSFRAPNIDDLTSRQQTGPGFQFENAGLEPETAITAEIGFELRSEALEANLWLYQSTVRDAITRVLRQSSECPPQTPQCGASWSRIQLINAPGRSVIRGLEVSGKALLPAHMVVSTSLSLTHGEMDNPMPRPSNPRLHYEETVPISRIPPLNGTLELRWRPPVGIYAGAGLRWAKEQTRLSISDTSDERIPAGGTPGFAVVDLRAGYRFRRQMVLAAVLENVFNTPYRYHGSSVNGPARGVLVSLETGL